MITLATILLLAAPAPPAIVHLEVPWPGAAPAEIEAGAVLPLEARAQRLDGLAHVESTTDEGVARLRLQFAPGVDAHAAARRVAEAVRGVTLPADAEAPLVRTAPAGSVHLLTAELDQGEAARRALERLPGVRDVATCGLADPTVLVTLDPARQAAFGLTPGDVATALATPPLAPPPPPEALGDALLRANPLVRLRDVAQVEVQARADCTCRLDGHPAVCFRVHADAAPAWPEVVRPYRPTTRRTLRVPRDVAARPPLGPGLPGLVWLPEDGDGRWYSTDAGPAQPVPGVRIGPPEAADDASTHVWVIGADDAARAAALRALEARWPAAEGPPPPKPTLDIRPAPSAARLGVTDQDIARALRTAVAGSPIGRTTLDGATAPVVLRTGPPPDDPAALANLTLTTAQGARVPLSAVATLRQTLGPAPRRRRDGQRAEPRRLPGVTLEAARAGVAQLPLPPGVRVEVVAETDD
ncbi:MAG: efflux RND transporter permease subunit [Myxococcales bacterium]|nr:efflux RND transporter permease subunit [Myxococcales bacterium]